MGFRETINQNSVVSSIVVGCVVVAGGIAIFMELRGNNGLPPANNFYTVDDGQTWFSDSAKKAPPYDHGGSQAVRCYVFKGPTGKFVGLLEKYDEGTRTEVQRRLDEPTRRGGEVSVMIKKPGEKQWTSAGPDQEAMILMHITSPDGSAPDRVMP